VVTFSVTERATYKRCRRKWHLSSQNRRNLQPSTSVSKSLDLGALVHKSLASWLVEPTADLSNLFLKHASDRLEELKQNYRAVTGGANPSNEELGPLLDIFELGHDMMANYQEYHGSPVPKRMRFCSPEQEVVVPIPGTQHPCETCIGNGKFNFIDCTACAGTGLVPHYLRGTLDGLLQDGQDRLYVLEHKTYGRRPNQDMLDTNDQFLAYLWVVRELNIGKVAGVAYDGMWKRSKPPRGSTMDDLFTRTILSRARAELDEFGVDLAKEANEMAGDPPIYTNRRWEGCYDCSYEKLCRAMSCGEDVGHIERTQYVERKPESSLGVYVGQAEEESEPF
jgi:hypothetical protein